MFFVVERLSLNKIDDKVLEGKQQTNGVLPGCLSKNSISIKFDMATKSHEIS